MSTSDVIVDGDQVWDGGVDGVGEPAARRESQRGFHAGKESFPQDLPSPALIGGSADGSCDKVRG